MRADRSQFEAEVTKERTQPGLELLRKRGNGTRKKKYQKGHAGLEMAIDLYLENFYTITEICESTGVSRPTLYSQLKKRGIELKTK